jgi:hypothetical protein
MDVRSGDYNLVVHLDKGALISIRHEERVTMHCASGGFITSWASSATQHKRRCR